MRRDVLVVAHSYFPSDPRIRKEVDALVARGRTVDVVCLRGSGEAARERLGGLGIRRLPVARHRGAGLLMYMLEYAAFLLLATFAVSWIWLRGRHRVVQAHTLPDPLIFAGLLPRLLGARLVLDMHELAPELLASRFNLRDGHPAIGILRLAERVSCAFAHHVITVSEPVADRLVEAGVPRARITVIMNTAPAPTSSAKRSPPATPSASEEPFTLVYAGLLSELYDLETGLRALAILRSSGHHDIVIRLIGDGPALARLREVAGELSLDGGVIFEGRVAPGRVAEMLTAADAGLVPLSPVPYMEYALPTKVFECVAAGLPVITTRMRTVRHYLDEDAACYVDPADAEQLAARILELRGSPELRRRYVERGREVTRPLAWEAQAARYVGLVDALSGSGERATRE